MLKTHIYGCNSSSKDKSRSDGRQEDELPCLPTRREVTRRSWKELAEEVDNDNDAHGTHQHQRKGRCRGNCSLFLRDYRNQRPVVVRDFAFDWEAMKTWKSSKHLKNSVGEEMEVMPYAAKDNLYFLADKQVVDVLNMKFGDFIDKVFDEEGEEEEEKQEEEEKGRRKIKRRRRLYLRAPLFETLRKEIELTRVASWCLSSSFFSPCSASSSLERFNEEITGLWIGSSGNRTPLHYDLWHGFLVQLVGCKRVILFHPDETKHLYSKAYSKHAKATTLFSSTSSSSSSSVSEEGISKSAGVDAHISEVDLRTWIGGVDEEEVSVKKEEMEKEKEKEKTVPLVPSVKEEDEDEEDTLSLFAALASPSSSFSPSSTSSSSPPSSPSPSCSSSWIDRVVEDWKGLSSETIKERHRHPLLAETRRWTTTLREGEALYIPPCWWHFVETEDGSPSISLTLRWDLSTFETVHSVAIL
jgi:hypothetical protein